ncbi:TPA: hypothetical protein F8R87_01870 [Legionella pneumophila]|nr:hypothetical protein [Legionella pneumophila]
MGKNGINKNKMEKLNEITLSGDVKMNTSNEIVLSKPEIYILISIMTNQIESGKGVEKNTISSNLDSVADKEFLSFKDFKLNLNIDRLLEKKLIARSDDYNQPAYSLTSEGTNWLLENEHSLKGMLSLEEA